MYQFSSVAQSCPTLCDPMNHSMPGLPVHHQLLEFTQTQVHWVGDAIQPFHLLSSPSPPALNHSQHQGLFQWVSYSHQVAKVLELYIFIYIWWSLYYIYLSLYRQIYIYTHIYIFTCVYVWWSCHQNTWWCLTEQKWLLLHHWIYIAQSHVHNSSQCCLNLENCWDKTFICHQHVGASARLWEYTR